MTLLEPAPLVAQALLDSPLGPLRAAASAHGLAGLWFEGQAHHPGPLDLPIHPDQTWLRLAAAVMADYWRSGRVQLGALRLAPSGTAFQRAVWAELLRIPDGDHGQYGLIARALGKPNAARAVGAAVGRNPISVLVPCHRVLGQQGSLTGYAGGLPRKQALLALEAQARGEATLGLDQEWPACA